MQRQGAGRTYIADARWRPATAFSEALDAETGELSVGAALLPGVDATGAQLHALVGIKSAGNHLEEALLDGIEDFMGVGDGTDADVSACRMLHLRSGRRTGQRID